MLSRWRGRDPACPPDQVANAKDSMVDLSPVSEAPAAATRAGWAALLPGQDVPLIGERVYDAEPCDD
jgi:hypothetical protein